jgi:hypothetical protein
MLREDAQEFVSFVLSQPRAAMIAVLSSEPHLHLIVELPSWPEVYLWNQDFPFEPRWVQVREGSHQGWYALTPRDRDPVVQFGPSVLRPSGELSEGWIWAGCPDPAFLKWYDRLANWIRKRYKVVKKRGNSNLYAGQHAWEWKRAGGVFAR